MTPAEREARRRAKLVQFKPADRAALDSAAEAAGKTAPELVADLVAAYLDGGKPPPPPPVSAEETAAAQVFDRRRRQILASFAEILNQAQDDQALERIERRVSILQDMINK
ncbi:hypothetical protein [Telmatospirillum sp. J64-1]|uniref:hypothetical protein n=1 Tax=Telmatospirillum sp. J64-1 TaxID=2502183 RepID=UPI00115CB66C|nr:hypothetical protein [Telmatospirillum sp. J64-1]